MTAAVTAQLLLKMYLAGQHLSCYGDRILSTRKEVARCLFSFVANS